MIRIGFWETLYYGYLGPCIMGVWVPGIEAEVLQPACLVPERGFWRQGFGDLKVFGPQAVFGFWLLSSSHSEARIREHYKANHMRPVAWQPRAAAAPPQCLLQRSREPRKPGATKRAECRVLIGFGLCYRATIETETLKGEYLSLFRPLQYTKHSITCCPYDEDLIVSIQVKVEVITKTVAEPSLPM